MDSRSPRDGRVIEELGTYDPMVRETDARAILKGCLLYTSPSPRDRQKSRMPSSA